MEREQEYLDAAAKALEAEQEDIKQYCFTWCPECQVTVPRKEDDPEFYRIHKTYETEWDIFVLIGCEGYWVINPNLLGIDAPNWFDSDEE